MDNERNNDLEMQRKMLQELEIVEETENSTKFRSFLKQKMEEMKSQVNEKTRGDLMGRRSKGQEEQRLQCLFQNTGSSVSTFFFSAHMTVLRFFLAPKWKEKCRSRFACPTCRAQRTQVLHRERNFLLTTGLMRHSILENALRYDTQGAHINPKY